MKARQWLCTLNNPEVALAQDYLEKWHTVAKADYVCGQLEQGQEGTIHIQYYLWFKNQIRLTGLKKYCSKSHFEPVKVNNGADEYCLKEETRLEGPWQFGVRPLKRNSKTDWERVFQLAQQGKFEEIPADVKVQHYANLQKIKKDNLVVQDKDHLRGVWIWGKSGVGKSRKAREDYPDHYPKLCNKWWDGYQGQRHVIMDDIGKDHHVLGQQLKIWADRYGCILETKGGAVVDNYEWFVVTSQYRIEDIWQDQETCEALHRRFKVIHMDSL